MEQDCVIELDTHDSFGPLVPHDIPEFGIPMVCTLRPALFVMMNAVMSRPTAICWRRTQATRRISCLLLVFLGLLAKFGQLGSIAVRFDRPMRQVCAHYALFLAVPRDVPFP